MNGSMKQFVAVAVFAALSAACGGTGSNSRDAQTTATPGPNATPTAAATATPHPLPDGIYVSANGNDSASGAPHDPVRTLGHALDLAQATSRTQVFAIGGGANGLYD